MHILRVEHPVPDFDAWKQAFDSDPVSREKGGVRRHRVLRPIDDAGYVMIDLEFDSARDAEAFLGSLRELWSRVEARFGWTESPRARTVEVVESKEH